jgi:hypothetical protein
MDAFLTVASAKRMLKSGLKLPLAMRVICLLKLAYGYPADVAYNWIVGSARHRAWPKKLIELYSERLERLVWEPYATRDKKAVYWVKLILAADPTHWRNLPEDL